MWAVPFHPGAVRAFKEAKVWGEKEDAHNAALLARQDVLIKAWAEFMKGTVPADAAEMRKAWMAVRKSALEKAKMDVVFEQ